MSYELRYDDESLPLETVDGTEPPYGVHIGKLLSTTGRVTFDPGYGNTAPSVSAITFIDGDAGILRYRGYPIEQLAEQSTFLETSYLLIYGELPTAAQLEDFQQRIKTHTMLHEEFKSFFAGFPRDAHRCRYSLPGSARCRPSTRTASTRSTSSTSSSRPCACSQSCRRLRPMPTRKRSDSRSSTRTTHSATSRTSCECASASPRNRTKSILRWPRSSTCCSSCMPTTSRTARRRPCAWSAHRTRTSSRRSPPASTRCSVRSMAAPTRRSSRCCRTSRPRVATSPRSCSGSRTRSPASS